MNHHLDHSKKILASTINETLSSFFDDSLVYFNVKSLTFDLTFVNSKYQKFVINYRVDTCILRSIKLHFL